MPIDLTGRERLPTLPESTLEQVEVAKQRYGFCKTIAIEILGWTVEKREVIYNHRKWKDWDTWSNRDGIECIELPDFLRDANAARLVLAEIERRGLHLTFMGIMDDMTHDAKLTDWEWAWKLMNASPEAICLAALAAVRGGKG